MKKVLQVLSGLSAGGAESMLMNIYRNIDTTKVKFDFVVFGNENGIFSTEVINKGGKIFRVNALKEKGIINFIKEMKNIIKENGPYDAIHSHVDYLSGLVLMAAKICDVPIRISHSHSTNAITHRGKLNYVTHMFLKFLISINTNYYLACNKEAAQYMFGKRNAKKAIVINNAIDLYKFSEKGQYEKNKIIDVLKLNISNKTKIITNIGRFVEAKNHRVLIDIFNSYHQKVSDSVLLLIGEGKLKKDIFEYVKNKNLSNCVRFLGATNDIPQILHISDAVVLPSIYEGLPVTLIEAQAMNVPCVVSDTIKKDVDCNLDLIYFKDYNDIEDYSNTIKEVTQKRKWIDNSFNMTKKGYNINNNISIIYDIYGIKNK